VGRDIAVLFHDRGTRRGWVFSGTPRPHFTPGKDPVPILQEAEWAPGPVWTDGKSRPHRESIPDRPANSQSPYRLSYPAHIHTPPHTHTYIYYLYSFNFPSHEGCFSPPLPVHVVAISWILPLSSILSLMPKNSRRIALRIHDSLNQDTVNRTRLFWNVIRVGLQRVTDVSKDCCAFIITVKYSVTIYHSIK